MMILTSCLSRLLKATAKTTTSSIDFTSIRRIGKTNHLFDETPHQDLFSLNALLVAHVRRGDAIEAWDLFLQIHRLHSDLSAYIFTTILGACSALSDAQRGQEVHALVIKTGTESETITKTALIDMYSKCSRLSDSVHVFKETKLKDVVTWNTMISGFLRHGLARDALGVFEAMQRERVKFSGFTLCSVLKVCASLKARRLGKQIHSLVIVMCCDLLVLGTALVDFYSNCLLIEEAMKLFYTLNCRKDDAIYNALVSGCVKNQKYREAISILSKMKPNVIALTTGLTACSAYSDLLMGKQIHCVAIRYGFELDTQLNNALLDMYGKCGKISTVRVLFDRIPHRNVVSWTTIIDACGSQGCGIEALELFKKMEESGVAPNPVTFLAVLSACGHSGLVEQGRECFFSMREKLGINPGPEHYSCFIDLLGRAGLIEEVWGLFFEMGNRGTMPTGEVLAAILNACKVNLDIERGEFAAKCLFELEPDKPGNYVLLANFYAAIGRWDHTEELRSVMNEKGLQKEAGSSWVTVE